MTAIAINSSATVIAIQNTYSAMANMTVLIVAMNKIAPQIILIPHQINPLIPIIHVRFFVNHVFNYTI